MSDFHSLPSLTPLELSPPSPSPSPSPSPRPAAACCFFKASISSAVKNRPPLPRGREQAWRCRLSCRYGFVDVSFSSNVAVSRNASSSCSLCGVLLQIFPYRVPVFLFARPLLLFLIFAIRFACILFPVPFCSQSRLKSSALPLSAHRHV